MLYILCVKFYDCVCSMFVYKSFFNQAETNKRNMGGEPEVDNRIRKYD